MYTIVLFAAELCDVERDIKYRKNPVAESLAEATWLDYDMTCCRYVSLFLLMNIYKFHTHARTHTRTYPRARAHTQ